MRLLPIALLSLFLCATVAANPPPESHARLNEAFPDLVFLTPEGDKSSMSDYRGKVVLVKLWATWCHVCRAKWPQHQALYESVGPEQDVQFITLSIAEDPVTSEAWVDEQGYDVPLFENLINDRGAVLAADETYLFVRGTPTLFLIDRTGTLRKKAVGAAGSITEADIRSLL